MCAKTDLELLVSNKTFDSFDHLRGAIMKVVGKDVHFDQLGPVGGDGLVPIVRSPIGADWSCNLQARVANK